MGGGHTRAGTVAEQHRQTISGHAGGGDTGLLGPAGICIQNTAGLSFYCQPAVRLLQPDRLATQLVGQSRTIGCYVLGIITYMITQIETVPWRLANAALSRRDTGAHPLRRGPFSLQP